MNPFETRSIGLTLIMRNRLLPRVPTYETSTTVFLRISRWNPGNELLHVRCRRRHRRRTAAARYEDSGASD